MNTKTGITTVCVTSQDKWAIADLKKSGEKVIYVAYGKVPGFDSCTVERLGHFIDFEAEQYPETPDEVAAVLVRRLTTQNLLSHRFYFLSSYFLEK